MVSANVFVAQARKIKELEARVAHLRRVIADLKRAHSWDWPPKSTPLSPFERARQWVRRRRST